MMSDKDVDMLKAGIPLLSILQLRVIEDNYKCHEEIQKEKDNHPREALEEEAKAFSELQKVVNEHALGISAVAHNRAKTLPTSVGEASGRYRRVLQRWFLSLAEKYSLDNVKKEITG